MAGREPIGTVLSSGDSPSLAHGERRKSARYKPRMDRGHFGWWDGEHFRSAPVRLLNLSLEGAAVHQDIVLSEETAVWISIVGLEWAGWIAARVLGTLPGEGEGRVARLVFLAPLAYDVFRIAVWGFPDDHTPSRGSTDVWNKRLSAIHL